jgi:acetyl esterase/lipase
VEAGDFSSCPPVFIVVGDNEYLRDESRILHLLSYLMIVYFASKLAKNGGRVRLQNYIAMPHVFQIFQKHPSTHTSFREYAKFITEVTSGKPIESQMSIVNGKGVIEEQPLNLEQYPTSYSKKEVD